MDRNRELAQPQLERIDSVDELRGYCMFILIAASPLFSGFRELLDWPIISTVYEQLTHSTWHGLNYIDLGIGGFISIVGTSTALSLNRHRGHEAAGYDIHIRILLRGAFLFLLGVFYNGGMQEPWPDIRLAGVLQRIAICYAATALIFLHTRVGTQIVLYVTTMLAYWGVLQLAPVPDHGAGDLSFEGNVVAYVDRILLPGRPYFGEAGWDPEGILSTFPAIATCIGGALMGQFLVAHSLKPQDKVYWLLFAGAGILLVGQLWSTWIPFNKMLWTPTYALLVAGFHSWHQAAFYQVTDIWKKHWFFFFRVIGYNALFAYIAARIIPFDDITLRLLGGDIQRLLGAAGSPVLGIAEVALMWSILYYLYRRRINIRI